MNWLLDTNVVSETARSRPDKNVINWLSVQSRRDFAISDITLAELRVGASTAPESRRIGLMQWIDTEVRGLIDRGPLSLSTDILIDWIQLSRKLRTSGTSRDPTDMLIASTARVHNLTVVTRNVRDFADTGIVVYDPWLDQTHRMDPP